jgi:hypothetical protein
VQIDYGQEDPHCVGRPGSRTGDDISIDGTTGQIFAGAIDTTASEVKQVLEGKLKPEKSYTYSSSKRS